LDAFWNKDLNLNYSKIITKTKIAHKTYVHQKLKQNKLSFFKYELVKKNYELYKPTNINHKNICKYYPKLVVEILIIQGYFGEFLK